MNPNAEMSKADRKELQQDLQQDGFSYPITTPPTELEAPELTAILIDYFKSNDRKTVFDVMADVFDLEVENTKDSDYQKVYQTLYDEDTFKARDVDGQVANEYSLAGSPFKYMENYVG